MNKQNLNSWAISTELFNWIRENLPDGKTILELGSGTGTIELCKHYTVFSVEHNPEWLNRSESNYIFAPIVDGWYEIEVLKIGLPLHYDMLLIDGPTGIIGRQKFFDNLNLFNCNVPIIFDDTHRHAEHELAIKTAIALKTDCKQYNSAQKSFTVLIKSKL